LFFPPQAKISVDGDDFHNLVTLIAAVTVSIEINFDFFLFLLSTWNVTNGTIFGFGLEQCSQELEDQCWLELSMWGHFLSRDCLGIRNLREENHLVVVILAKWHINSGFFTLISSLLYVLMKPYTLILLKF
jgi:hypothetical protein